MATRTPPPPPPARQSPAPAPAPPAAPAPPPRAGTAPAPRYYPPPPAAAQVQRQQVNTTGLQPKAYWGLAIAAFLFSLVPGIVALYFSYRVGVLSSLDDSGGAERASRLAKTWGIVGLVIGIPLSIAIIASSGSSGSSY